MPIESFAFEDLETGWKLEETTFREFNLLVGLSGAGKTRILHALSEVRRAVGFHPVELNAYGGPSVLECRWALTCRTEQGRYVWNAETGASGRASDERIFRKEKIWLDGELLLERSKDEFTYGEKSVPRLSKYSSALELLESEEKIAPLYSSLDNWRYVTFPWPSSLSTLLESAKTTRQLYPALEALRAADVPIENKAFALQQDHPEEFRSVKETFCEIFPTVSDLRIATPEELGVELVDMTFEDGSKYTRLLGAIREAGVKSWITHFSQGMLKTLIYLLELTLAPPGAVFLVDEIENSLGVNCLDEAADLFLRRAGELQLIVTSHHPYVINNIPAAYWKLVTRKGSVVTVKDADSIPALRTASPLEKFTQLINLPEYEDSVA